MNVTNAGGVKFDPVKLNVSEGLVPTTNLLSAEIETSTASVSISGQALLKQRVFHGDVPRHRPVSQATMPGSQSLNTAHFLTKQDCQLLAQVYEFAQGSGADLRFADNLAFNLAGYRSSDNGRNISPHNRGTSLDGEGRIVSYSFFDKDAATIKRILASDSLKTTQLDLGYIRFQTNVDYSAISINHFEFLEQAINKFSAKGADVPPLDARFTRYEYAKERSRTHLSTEKYEFTRNGRVRKGTTVANANDPNTALDKNKKKSLKTKPETVQDMFRRVMAKAFKSGWGIRVRSLAEFLMRSGR